MTTILMRDEEMTGKALGEFTLDVLTESLTVRELLRSRVYQQIKDHNVRQTGIFDEIVQPSADEQVLNGERTARQNRPKDWKPYFERAVKAYEANRILVIVDDEQTESLDQQVRVHSRTEVVFMKLVPLVGG